MEVAEPEDQVQLIQVMVELEFNVLSTEPIIIGPVVAVALVILVLEEMEEQEAVASGVFGGEAAVALRFASNS